jgi:hypothetical protein
MNHRQTPGIPPPAALNIHPEGFVNKPNWIAQALDADGAPIVSLAYDRKKDAKAQVRIWRRYPWTIPPKGDRLKKSRK